MNVPEFPYDLALAIRAAYPELWKRHGTGGRGPDRTAFTGDDAFELYGRWLSGDQSDEVLDWRIRRRAAYFSRHRRDFRAGGVIAAIKWGGILPTGLPAMLAALPDGGQRLL